MKRKTTMLCVAVLAIGALSTTTLFAEHIAVDEYGNMRIDGARGPQGVLAPEPISGQVTLRYQLPFPGILGDVVLFEPPNFTQMSDIIRFPGNGCTSSLPSMQTNLLSLAFWRTAYFRLNFLILITSKRLKPARKEPTDCSCGHHKTRALAERRHFRPTTSLATVLSQSRARSCSEPSGQAVC